MKDDNYTYMPGNCQGNAGTEIVQQAPSHPGGQVGGVPNRPFPYQSSMQPQVTVLPANSLGMLFDIGYQRGLNDSYWKEWFKLWRQTNRRPRAKKGSCKVAIDSDKRIILSQVMSDCSWKTMPFISNCVGPITIAPIETPGFKLKNTYLVLLFKSNNISVTIDVRKVGNGAYLYEQFRKSGVKVASQLSKEAIKEGLVELLLSWDDWEFEEPVSLDVFAGWNSNASGSSRTFQSCENTTWGKGLGEELPVSEKSFPRITPTALGLETYIKELRAMFPDPAERMLIAVWPVMGLLSSLLRKNGMPIKAALNLIPTGGVDQEALAGLLQVFDRNRPGFLDAGMTKKQIDSILNESRDEVLLFDCRYQSNHYMRSKRSQVSDRLLRMMSENEKTPCGRDCDFAMAVLSDEQSGAFNILLPEMNGAFLQSAERFRRSRCLEMVFSGVVAMVEEHCIGTDLIFSRCQKGLDFRLVPIDTAVALLREFFRRGGHDLDKELELPDISDLAALIEDGDSDEEGLVQFVRVVRSHAEEWMCEEKSYGQVYHEGTFYYDEKYLYFPVEMLRDMFAEVHREALLPRVLVELRSKGMLITDGPNLTVKKVMIGNKRKDYYVFPIDLFNERGKPDIRDLARRGQDDE